MIHKEDNAEVEMKITDAGELFVSCPECKRTWTTKLNAVRESKDGRPFVYDGTGITLSKVPSAKEENRKFPKGKGM